MLGLLFVKLDLSNNNPKTNPHEQVKIFSLRIAVIRTDVDRGFLRTYACTACKTQENNQNASAWRSPGTNQKSNQKTSTWRPSRTNQEGTRTSWQAALRINERMGVHRKGVLSFF